MTNQEKKCETDKEYLLNNPHWVECKTCKNRWRSSDTPPVCYGSPSTDTQRIRVTKERIEVLAVENEVWWIDPMDGKDEKWNIGNNLDFMEGLLSILSQEIEKAVLKGERNRIIATIREEVRKQERERIAREIEALANDWKEPEFSFDRHNALM